MTGAPEKYEGNGGIGVPCSQLRPLQMAGPQVERLVLERRVRPDQPERQGGLDGEHHEQRPVARHPPPPAAQPGYRLPPAGARRLRRHCAVRTGFGGISGSRHGRSGRRAHTART